MLRFASQNGHLDVVRHLLASDRFVITHTMSDFNGKTAAEQARVMQERPRSGDDEAEEEFLRRRANCNQIADLIEAYGLDPLTIRRKHCQILRHLRQAPSRAADGALEPRVQLTQRLGPHEALKTKLQLARKAIHLETIIVILDKQQKT